MGTKESRRAAGEGRVGGRVLVVVARVVKAALALVAVGIVLLSVVWWRSRPPAPDPFYGRATRSGERGELLAAEPFSRGVPAGARGWRILFSTTRTDGSRAVASALVLSPLAPVPGVAPLPHPAPTAATSLRPVVAWAHGTSGVVAGCAPTLFDDPLLHVPAVPALLAEGWVFVATDYVGLGVESGGHAYLVGDEAARSVLDSVRATRALDGAGAGARVVVWGHSQGGGSALWAGQRAVAYAPELEVAGVAALAPATDLPRLLEAARATPFGRIVSAFLVASYAKAYPESEAWNVVGDRARWLLRDIAGRCVGGRETLLSVAEALAVPGGDPFALSPSAGEFGERLAENVPRGPFPAPLLVAQGEADDLVLPPIQEAWVAERCAEGAVVDYRTYPGRDHISLLADDGPLPDDLVAWTRERFVGAAAAGCRASAEAVSAHGARSAPRSAAAPLSVPPRG